MYQISSKTGVRHVVESEQPSGEAVLKMWHGRDLPTARCGRELEPVNFYEADEKPNPRYTCSRCFAGVPVGA